MGVGQKRGVHNSALKCCINNVRKLGEENVMYKDQEVPDCAQWDIQVPQNFNCNLEMGELLKRKKNSKNEDMFKRG